MLFSRDLVDVGQEALDRAVRERLVHGQVDLGIGHHFVEVLADLRLMIQAGSAMVLRPRRRMVVLGLTAVTIVAATALRSIATGAGRWAATLPLGRQLEGLSQRGIETRGRRDCSFLQALERTTIPAC